MVTLGTGLVVTLVFTPRSLFSAGRFRTIVTNGPGDSWSNVRRGEALLAEAVLWEKLGKSWVPHVAGIGVNVAAGLYLGLAHERWSSAAVAALGGAAITELKILTQPVTMTLAHAEYQRRFSRQAGQPATWLASPTPALSASIYVGPRSVVVAGTF